MTLYVSRDKRHPDRYDIGSALCLRTLELCPRDALDVREVYGDTPGKPSWLTGTPTLHAGGEVYRGHLALSQVQQLAVSLARATAAQTQKKSQEPHAASARRAVAAQPSMQLREGPRPALPTANGEEEGPDMRDLWASQMPEEEEEEEDSGGGRKITGDDLARAMGEREAARKQHGQQQPSSQQRKPPSPFTE